MQKRIQRFGRLLCVVVLYAILAVPTVHGQDAATPDGPNSGQRIFLPVVAGGANAAIEAAAAEDDLLITGVIDGPLTGGVPKAIELYAVNSIPDLSVYGLGSANNGGGTDGEEFTFPAVSVTAGTFIYVASEGPSFTTFFGFSPDYISSAADINGDDALELFTNGSVSDIFGDIAVDGTGQPWEYQDGWAYRVNGTGPDGSTFALGNWSFSGPNALDGETANASAATPFPTGTYGPGSTGDTPPVVVATTPADGATNVAVNSTVTVNFDETVDLSAAAATLECPAGTPVAFSGLPASDVTSVTLTPDADLPDSTLGSVTIVAAEVTDNDGTADNMAADYSFSFTTTGGSVSGGWVINELLADPAGDSTGDANGDGTRDGGQDEFVEIVNNSGAAVDISGWTLSDAVALRHTFPAGTVVPNQCAVVVFGGGTPSGGFGGSTVQTASTGLLGLNNGGDTITFSDTAGVVVSYVYGAEGGSDQALTRSPDITGPDPLVLHNSVAATLFSPGTRLDGTAFAGCPSPPVLDLKIHEIQGSGPDVTSPGATTAVEAVVVGDYQNSDQLRGFFIQEEDTDADADPATSEGIFVYCNSCPVAVAVGDLVTVTGAQTEFFGMSQLDVTGAGGAVSVTSSGNALPTPATLTLPLAPTAYEAFEGMLVTFPQTLTVSEYFELARYGQIVLTQGGRIEQFTNANAPNAAGYAAHLLDKAQRTVILDDDNNRQNAPLDFTDPAFDKAVYHPTPGGFSTGNFFRGGDTIANLTGVLHWSFAGQSGTDAWRIRPVPEQFSYAFSADNPRPGVPDVGGNLRVASFNVLNYFNGDGLGGGFPTARGADSTAEFDRQTDKIVAAITALDADVIGLMEIENDYADGANSAIADLADALNAIAGAGTYAYVDPGTNVGTDEIAVGMLYKPAVVALLGTPAILDSAAFVNPLTPDPKNRPAVAQSFRIGDSANPGEGEIFTVVVNHLKSKGSACGTGDDDPATGQGNCNATRAAAAQELVDWLATDPTGSGDPDVLIIGDLNAYAKEDPITTILNAGYADLVDQFTGGDGYSFVFDGEIGYLDHALANGTLAGQVTGTAVWHVNADEVNLLDYNDPILDTSEPNFERKTTVNDLYDPDAYRSSDHDPVLIGLGLYPDRSDLPASYGTARHNGQGATLRLGAAWSGEASSTPGGDDATDDGVAVLPAYAGDGSYAVDVNVSNTGVQAAQLVGWVDFDESGTFEQDEMSLPDLANLSGSCSSAGGADGTFTTGNIPAGCTGTVTLEWSGITATPAAIYLRIRLTSDDGVYGDANFFSDASPSPTGLALDGEAEDFASTPLAVTLGYAAATRQGEQVDFFWQTVAETGTAGFNVLAEVGDQVTLLNEQLIPSPVIDSVTPTDYSFSALTPGDVYYIEEVTVAGKLSRHGPFQVGVEYGSYTAPADIELRPVIWLPLILR